MKQFLTIQLFARVPKEIKFFFGPPCRPLGPIVNGGPIQIALGTSRSPQEVPREPPLLAQELSLGLCGEILEKNEVAYRQPTQIVWDLYGQPIRILSVWSHSICMAAKNGQIPWGPAKTIELMQR